MKFSIKHEMMGRMRVHLSQNRMTYAQADILLYFLQNDKYVTCAKVYERTGDAVISYTGERSYIIQLLQGFCYEKAEVPTGLLEHSGRELNAVYQEKLIGKVLMRYVKKIVLPYPVYTAYITLSSLKYIAKGIQSLWHRKIEVAVLDATAIGVSVLRKDFGTAGSVMFLLGIGELLEEWTHKKSVDDLARTMALNVGKVWLKSDGQEVLVSVNDISAGDEVVVHMGNVIPFDGEVSEGEAMVNQASLTGESLPVRKAEGNYVYAGTVLEEGELTILVKEVGGSSRFEKIVTMIEESEKLKSSLEGKAEHLADRLVPYTLGGTALTYLLTRNTTKALSVLMVDFSCALKLSMPIAVISAMRESAKYNVSVKGGRFLEAVAKADTVVFDKTGTLTLATPRVAKIVTFGGRAENDMLRLAACLEEHYPHSLANAVVEEAARRGLNHEEYHSSVEYVVAHGISSTVEGRNVVIGSYHFVFEDEGCTVPDDEKDKFDNISDEYSHLYLAVSGVLRAVICISDPLRPEAPSAVAALHKAGIKKVVMMTGDNEKTAAAVARAVGVDEYRAEVLPEDKAEFIRREKAAGHTVIMIGDGVNDTPALSEADVGIAINTGAAIAKEISDITVSSEDLFKLVTLREISSALMERINRNYRFIVSFNFLLIVCGVTGVIQPTTSALLHNMSTLGISIKSMTDLLPEEKTIRNAKLLKTRLRHRA